MSKPSNTTEVSSTTDNLKTTVFGCLSVTPATTKAKRLYMFQMICIPFIPILALFIQNLIIFLQQIEAYDEAKFVNQQVVAILSLTFNESFKSINIVFSHLADFVDS